MIVAWLWACAVPEPVDLPIPELDAPQLFHGQPTGVILAGDELSVEVRAEDPDGIYEVSLYWRVVGSSRYDKVPLSLTEEQWVGTLEAQAPGIEYWFKAIDDSDYVVSAVLPEEAGEGPFTLEVASGATVAPWFEDFDSATEAFSLYGLGFSDHALQTPGFEWSLSQVHRFSGEWAVRHRRGLDNGAIHDDWLVSPRLDLSAMATAQVSWFEYGDEAASSTHEIWVSTGSPDPADGDFVWVASVHPPLEDEWAPGQVVDLSPWAGEERVSIAWRYLGNYADMWVIDDVGVDARGPDVHLLDFTQATATPGEVCALAFDLENRGVSWEAFELFGSLDGGATDFALTGLSLEEGALRRVEVQLAIDPLQQDNVLEELEITATDGTLSWTWTPTLMVGEPSSAWVEVELDEEAYVEVVIGAGDPASPAVELVVSSAILSARAHSWQVDLTSIAQALPPVNGPDRWWTRLDGDTAGDLNHFEIATDGVLYGGELGPFSAGEPQWFYLPPKPRPVVVSSQTHPEPIAPGDTVEWELIVDNGGGPTVGSTSLTLSSASPHVSFDDPQPTDLGVDWAGPTHVLPTVSIDASKTDGFGVPITLTVTDAQEAFSVDTWLEVPWPVLEVIDVTLVDFDGDGDGLLDVAETATLGVRVTNIGTLASGSLDCILSAAPGVSVLQDQSLAAPLPPGEAAPLEYEIRLDSGVVGAPLDLVVDCGDGRGEWSLPVQLFVSQPGWSWFTALPDPSDDAVEGYGFDLVLGRWRVAGSTLMIELTSSVDYDPSSVFIEAWMESDLAAWDQYQLVAQSGYGSLRGYTLAAWWSLTDPVITDLDSRRLAIDVDLTSMALSSNTLSLGFASGWCGGSTYFCDHYPDGWGDPYVAGLVPDQWVDLDW
jgi:hypothetical protein